MSIVLMTVGAPASGKTTWARQFVKDNKNTAIVCRDDIRLAYGLESGDNEKLVTKVHRTQIEAALLDGMDVVVSDTNLNAGFRKSLVKFAHEHGADVLLHFFPISLDEAIRRDAARANTVGANIVKRFHDMYVQQGHPTDPHSVQLLARQQFAPYEPRTGFGSHNMRAVVVDIDGTLAHMKGRSPYDETRVMEDEFDNEVAAAVQGMADLMDAHVLVVSGRTDQCRELTQDWLDLNHFEHEALIMRKHGDTRPDWIVKNEIYDEQIIPQYNVLAAFDDRDQVVRHVRARGIKVFQVAYGRF